MGNGIFRGIFVSLLLIDSVAIFLRFYNYPDKLDLLVLDCLIDKLVFVHPDGVRFG